MTTERLKHIWQLLLLYAILVLAGTVLISFDLLPLNLLVFLITATVSTLITLTVYLLVSKGIEKGGSHQGIYTLAAISGKFLGYIIFILIYWGVVKNLSKPFIIAFFALYLLLTFFLIRILFKLLKTN